MDIQYVKKSLNYRISLCDDTCNKCVHCAAALSKKLICTFYSDYLFEAASYMYCDKFENKKEKTQCK